MNPSGASAGFELPWVIVSAVSQPTAFEAGHSPLIRLSILNSLRRTGWTAF
jgi:hypothetical protein